MTARLLPALRIEGRPLAWAAVLALLLQALLGPTGHMQALAHAEVICLGLAGSPGPADPAPVHARECPCLAGVLLALAPAPPTLQRPALFQDRNHVPAAGLPRGERRRDRDPIRGPPLLDA